MTNIDWTSYIVAKAIGWLWPLAHLFGLGVCAWAYRRCRKAGYLIVATYYLLALCGLLLGPAINRAIGEYSHAQSAQPPSPEAQKQYLQELNALNEKYYPTGRVAESNVKFPFGPVVLVSGLWFIARRESQRITA
jgi:hypothetical protein